MKQALSLLGLVGTLALAFGFDRWLDYLRIDAARTFDVTPNLWAGSLGQLLVAGTLLALAWYMMCHRPKSNSVALVFLVAGLVMTLFPPIYGEVLERMLSPQDTTILPLSFSLVYLSPGRLLSFAGAAIAAIGVVTLLDRTASARP
jgi:hypothetical protein